MTRSLACGVLACCIVVGGFFGGVRRMVAQGAAPLTLRATIPLPGYEGDFDHFAYDLKRNRLILAAEEHHTVDLFDLKTGKHLRTLTGFKAPHSIAYVPGNDEIFITDGEDASCIILSAKDLHRIARIPLRPGADAALYDAESGRFYIGNGGRDANQKTSVITIVSVTENRKIGEIPVDGNNLEAMAVDHAHDRLFVNIRDKKEIGVVDLKSNRVVATWTADGVNKNTPMQFDAPDQRLFVAGRNPGQFFVFNTANGKLIAKMSCVETVDNMTWDPATRRIFVTGSDGISIYRQKDKDHYVQVARMETVGGKTSVYVPELKQLYVAHPKGDTPVASVLIYSVHP